MTVLGNRGLSLRKLIITQLLSICRLVTSSLKRQKQTLLILVTLGCNFRVWSTILKQVKDPQSPCRSEIKIKPHARRPKCTIFPFFLYFIIIIIYYCYYFFCGGWGGGGLNYPSWLQPLKRIEWNCPSPPPIPLRTRMIYVKAITCHLFGGDGRSYGELRGRSSRVPLLDFHGIRLLLSGQTM